mmetsp:Transcript_4968/g.10697  ORF Transcript_4968/g.10697 Transcript_4968/m.10697 type:complete len:217 (-) Transcript_4968:440-1090(-)|eukprot:CAMPEP_0202906200 /NCGR_PEP_ID=MMETSP1392-20130828/37756_1 /ASSEMBLY_ACC=CAM_ASM_000868 /TAXON_ID=225041 /ORGANISM="Chlamydomonas chlamydogama, Strain SAG 11-48b" /LENGTH=216 /DNA_ID=CAMNT_0049594591 /DNA_START=102 /DNA_END=752 /DNA_ORIENTATION=-
MLRFGPVAQVRENLYLGGAGDESDLDLLKTLGITHILQVGAELKPSFPTRFAYQRIAIDDYEGEDIVQHLPKCFDFITAAHEANGTVLVHCMAGVSRSPTVCMAWLMHKEKMVAADARSLVKAARSCVMPNMGFVLQLDEWEKLGDSTQERMDKWEGWNRGKFSAYLAVYRKAQQERWRQRMEDDEDDGEATKEKEALATLTQQPTIKLTADTVPS